MQIASALRTSGERELADTGVPASLLVEEVFKD